MRNLIATALGCATLAGCAGTREDTDFCRMARRPGVIVHIENALVFFDPGSARLNPAAVQTLDRHEPAIWLKCVDRVDIVGHTDRSGSSAENLKLSLRRTEAVRDALIARGASENHFILHAVGEDDPLVPTADGVAEPQNRFVEILPGALKQD